MTKLAFIVAALAACGGSKANSKGSDDDALASEPRCREVAAKMSKLMSLDPPKDVLDREVEHCTKKYTNKIVDCILTATTSEAARQCHASVGQGKQTDADVAEHLVKRIAFEAYPLWASKHPDAACPAKPQDLDAGSLADPWGHDVKLYCGSDLPAGARGVGVASAGPDGKFDTPDDIKSW